MASYTLLILCTALIGMNAVGSSQHGAFARMFNNLISAGLTSKRTVCETNPVNWSFCHPSPSDGTTLSSECQNDCDNSNCNSENACNAHNAGCSSAYAECCTSTCHSSCPPFAPACQRKDFKSANRVERVMKRTVCLTSPVTWSFCHPTDGTTLSDECQNDCDSSNCNSANACNAHNAGCTSAYIQCCSSTCHSSCPPFAPACQEKDFKSDRGDFQVLKRGIVVKRDICQDFNEEPGLYNSCFCYQATSLSSARTYVHDNFIGEENLEGFMTTLIAGGVDLELATVLALYY